MREERVLCGVVLSFSVLDAAPDRFREETGRAACVVATGMIGRCLQPTITKEPLPSMPRLIGRLQSVQEDSPRVVLLDRAQQNTNLGLVVFCRFLIIVTFDSQMGQISFF